MRKINQIYAVYFSPTGGTEKIVTALAGYLCDALGTELKKTDFTLPESREKTYSFSEDDLVVFGSPVYAGRLPNKIMPDIGKCFSGNNTPVIAVTVFGNRSFGGALTELRLILQKSGFKVAGAAAAACRHTFSQVVASGRPDENDMSELEDFAGKVLSRLNAEDFEPLTLPPDTVVEPYYTPLKEDGTPAKFLKAKPLTDPEKCDRCGKCISVCPMGSIDENAETPGTCIKCQACIRKCPKNARYFDDEAFLSHVRMLEKNFTRRADNYFEV